MLWNGSLIKTGLRSLGPLSSSLRSWLQCSRQPLNLVPSALFHQGSVLSESGPSYKGRRMGFRPWQRGFWIKEGERAQAGALILRQVNLQYHPGEHVGIGKDKTLYALEAGHVFITSEIIDPKWSNRFIQESYTARKGQMMFKHFVHIAADPLPQKFKLVTNI